MANTPQAEKRVRQAEKKRRHNMSLRSMTRTMVKNTVKAIDAGKAAEAHQAYQRMVPVLDRAATKGLLSLNKASRHKSRLLIKLRQLPQEVA